MKMHADEAEAVQEKGGVIKQLFGEYTIVRSSKRKTMSMGTLPDGTMTVQVPTDAANAEIQEFVLDTRLEWMEKYFQEKGAHKVEERTYKKRYLPGGDTGRRLPFEYVIVRSSKRKSITAILNQDGTVEIRVPAASTNSEIRDFLLANKESIAEDIRKKKARRRSEMPEAAPGEDAGLRLPFEYVTVRERNREKISVSWQSSGAVKVRAPETASDSDIEDFLLSNKKRIERYINRQKVKKNKKKKSTGRTGASAGGDIRRRLPFEYVVVRNSRRKKMDAILNPDGIMEIRVPEAATDFEIWTFLSNNKKNIEDYIGKHKAAEQKRREEAATMAKTNKRLPFEYVVVRNSRRKYMFAKLLPDGMVEVRAPESVTDADVKKFLFEHLEQIKNIANEKKAADQREQAAKAEAIAKGGIRKNLPFKYVTVRNGSRSDMAVFVKPDDSVEVRVPVTATRAEIEDFVFRHRKWVEYTLRKQKAINLKKQTDRARTASQKDARRSLPFEYKVVRNDRRKNIGIFLQQDDSVEVRVPTQATRAEIEDFVFEQRSWVEDNLRKQKARRLKIRADRARATRQEGAHKSLPFEYETIRNDRRKTTAVVIQPHGIVEVRAPMGETDEDIADFVFSRRKWIEDRLRKQKVKETVERLPVRWTYDDLIERTKVIAKKMGFSPSDIVIKTVNSYWGRCDSSGTISLNEALTKMPGPVVDYVIIHEISHLKYMNHSTKFWVMVAKYCKDYLKHRRWLKENMYAVD